ncbi:hypothetical protein K402DRAFT_465988 [Aulographum hederae CBS 113979]|uniref:DNA/RNA-binding protein Kin17 WH-like domain-containing protein n=1 Tax=Aulographum hederae CBS 113979 TaxID=1176131 RepID=A0A6G1GRL7_9PEZI|nr:hypothetical protein K402DRAFT_465988 [Aulographum hederae CBS 113979]
MDSKALSKKMKAAGLGRLRWYCQVCERQMRDENGFKCHTQTEAHVRAMLLVGENQKKFLSDYSRQFQNDFMKQLRTAHGEKKVHVNHFYQEYINDKQHIHMNATRWSSLTEFAKHLGREGLCRVEENEKGVHIAWIDNSPEALRRQDAARKKERQDRGDEEREQKLIEAQIKKANEIQKAKDAAKETERAKEEAAKAEAKGTDEPENAEGDIPNPPEPGQKMSFSFSRQKFSMAKKPTITAAPAQEKSKIKNVFASGGKKRKAAAVEEEPKKKMSEAERIMRAEMDRKRVRAV